MHLPAKYAQTAQVKVPYLTERLLYTSVLGDGGWGGEANLDICV
jgi:hypothetical protein